MAIVLKIGGSLVFPGKTDAGYVKEVSSILQRLKRRTVVGVVVGMGKRGEKALLAARKRRVSEYDLDAVAIRQTRKNAMLLRKALGLRGKVPATIDEARREAKRKGITVMGGTVPGHTTNTVAALLAEAIGAKKLVNATNVDGVYTKDPRKHKSAKKFRKMKFARLISLSAEQDARGARTHFVFDLLAAKLIARSKIRTFIINGTPGEIESTLKGRTRGTVVQ
ncbi:MAG: UMP kinase [Candidatus Diapherotrites archaeon]|nr:UMP kinase [Candidatus Diapherotrites archaeon]